MLNQVAAKVHAPKQPQMAKASPRMNAVVDGKLTLSQYNIPFILPAPHVASQYLLNGPVKAFR